MTETERTRERGLSRGHRWREKSLVSSVAGRFRTCHRTSKIFEEMLRGWGGIKYLEGEVGIFSKIWNWEKNAQWDHKSNISTNNHNRP